MLDFNPLYSTPQVEAVERFINQQYSLAGRVSCRLLQRGLNDVYLAVGGDSERYVFRLSHQRARGPADVKTETAFLRHAGEYASRAQKWGSETVGWIAREADFLETWEMERFVDRLF